MKTYQEFISEAKKCWPGYKKKGTQKLFGKTYNRCVKEDILSFAKRQEKKGKENGPKPTRTPKELIDLAKKLEKKEEYQLEEDWSKSYKRSIDCNNPKGFSQKAHCAGRKKRADGGETKSTSPFKEMYEIELEESYDDEKKGRRTRRVGGKLTLARGRGADMTRQERTTAAIAKKAGLKGTGKYSTKDLRTKPKDYTTYDSEDDLDDIGSTEQDHFIRTYSSARKAAKGQGLISKMKPAGRTATGVTKFKVAPSSESVRRVKDLKKHMTKAGANKTGKVHTVDIMHRDSNVVKNDPDQQMERGRNFIRAVKSTPHHLKVAGAKKGDTVIGRPSAVLPGETTDPEKKKTGETKRAKLYKKIFGRRSSGKSKKTGLMVGKMDGDISMNK